MHVSLPTEVHYGPSFTIKREPQFGIPILQGMTVMLGCDVDANPVINATGWLKNEKQVEHKQKLYCEKYVSYRENV